MKQWFAVEPELSVFNYSMGSVVADLAKKNKQILRCHNLVWGSQLAPWGLSSFIPLSKQFTKLSQLITPPGRKKPSPKP
jgi:GH35 family endo-1,4-beta-xylanase